MTQSDLLAEFYKYSTTQDFRHNVYANWPVIDFDILLLLIFVLILFWAFKLPSRKLADSKASLYAV